MHWVGEGAPCEGPLPQVKQNLTRLGWMDSQEMEVAADCPGQAWWGWEQAGEQRGQPGPGVGAEGRGQSAFLLFTRLRMRSDRSVRELAGPTAERGQQMRDPRRGYWGVWDGARVLSGPRRALAVLTSCSEIL